MKDKPLNKQRVDYLEEPHIKKHAVKSKEGLAKWIRLSTATQYKKEIKK